MKPEIIIISLAILYLIPFILIIFLHRTVVKNGYIKSLIKAKQIVLKFPELPECMQELGYWQNLQTDTPESNAARDMYCLVKKKIMITLNIN